MILHVDVYECLSPKPGYDLKTVICSANPLLQHKEYITIYNSTFSIGNKTTGQSACWLVRKSTDQAVLLGHWYSVSVIVVALI